MRKLAQPNSAWDGKIYILLDELQGQMESKDFYVVANLTDAVMVIG